MAYATKYLFKWQSAKGTTREIRVLKNGYSGSVIQRALGRAPILKKQKNGTVFGTSLEFYAECQVEGEFTEFYTTNPKAYKVQLYAGNDLLWQGYVTPELYSEPDIAPPFDVQVIATDGIGELKLYDFEPQGTVTLRSIFTYLLGYTGLGTDVYLISSLKAGSSGAGALLEKTINLDYMAGESCYDVLTYLLDTLHATITWWNGAWIVARETNVTFTSGKVRYFNTAGNSALLAGSVQTLGKMYTNDVWPVGQLSRKVDPAKKSVTVQAPWHVVTAFVNSGMDSDSGWTKANNASFDSAKKAYYLPDNVVPYQGNPAAEISQAVSMGGLRVPLSFSGKFCATELPPFSGATYGGVVGVDVLYVTGNVSYYLTKDDNGDTVWKQGNGGKYDFQIRLSQVNTDEAGAEELTFEVPPLMLNNTYPSGTLTFHIVGRSALVFNAFLDIKISKGYQDRLHIDNGARGEEGEYEVAIGRETSDIDYYKAFMQGILLDSGSLITSFKDDAITTGMDFLAFISRDYARSFALPRIVRTGTVQLEAAVQFPPLVLTKAAVDYWLETWSWNMYEDELDITARSLPTASITVDSEVISEASGTTSGGSGSGGGSSSMSGGGGSNYFEPDDEVESAVALKAAYIAISAPDFLIGDNRESLVSDIEIVGSALQSLQAQIDSVATKTNFDELTATAVAADIVAASRVYAERYYLTDDIYFYIDVVDGTPCVHLNADFITDGDQILGDGTPGGGGGGGVTYFSELQDVSNAIAGMSSSQLANKMLIWDTGATPVGGESATGAWSVIDKSSVGITTDATQNLHGLMSAADKVKLDSVDLTSIAHGETAYGWGNHATAGYLTSSDGDTITKSLQSLQAQLDSVASRDCFDELTANAIFADVIAASDIYAALHGSLEGNADTATDADKLDGVHASGLFTAMSSGAATNLSVTIGGTNKTATLYATYDSASENISDKFGIVGSALQSLQGQIDAVASRVDLSDYEATTEAKMDYICDLLGSLQAQIDSVSTRIDDGSYGYFDMLSVGSDIYCDYVYTTGDQVLSDERKKNITREIVLTAEQIASCRAVAFDWKDKPGSSFGSIAQDWQKILPESVRLNGDTLYLSSTKSAMVAVINLAREVVELRKKLEQVKPN